MGSARRVAAPVRELHKHLTSPEQQEVASALEKHSLVAPQ